MNRAKFTQGPLEAVGNLVRTQFEHGDADKRGWLVAEVSGPFEEANATARLFAAAPVLLKTLQDLEGWLRESGYGENHPWRLAISQAIAKAGDAA